MKRRSRDPLQIVGSGSLARCLQHETNHLDGVPFTDRIDTKRRAALKGDPLGRLGGGPVPTVKISLDVPVRGRGSAGRRPQEWLPTLIGRPEESR